MEVICKLQSVNFTDLEIAFGKSHLETHMTPHECTVIAECHHD